jgi:hypothetical protein
MKRADFYTEGAIDWPDLDDVVDEPAPTWPEEDNDCDVQAAGSTRLAQQTRFSQGF